MKAEIIQSLTNDFEAYARQTESGVEFWLACDVQILLGYEQWKNFKTVIDKARTACKMAEHRVSNHFAGAGKTIKMPKGVRTTLPNYSGARGSRDACHQGGILVVSLKRQKANKRW